MTFCYIFGTFSFFMLTYCTDTVHSKSILAVAISSRGDKISLDSTDASIRKLETTKTISSETIRKGSKQDNDEDEATTQTNVGTPLQVVVNSVIVPGVEYAAASILKAVSSPFEFLTKSVSDYVNPSTSTTKPAKKVPATNPASSSPSRPVPNQQSQVTYVVLSPDQNGPASESSPKVPTPPPPQQTTVSKEEDEEDDEEIEDDLF